MKILDNGLATAAPEDQHPFRMTERGGLSSGPVVIVQPHLTAECLDCGWKYERDLPFRHSRRKPRPIKLNLKHDCVPKTY